MEDVQQYGCTEGMKRKGVDSREKQKTHCRTGANSASVQGRPNGANALTSEDGYLPETFEGLAYPSNSLSFGKNREALGHAAAYPVKLPEFFIKAYSEKSDIIYDPFCGSGTTLIAAEQLERTCYGVEISPAYCDVIVQRWENMTGEKARRQ